MRVIKKASIVTLGCKVNWYDSQAMAEALASAGFEITTESGEAAEATEAADVYIVNTCAVTAAAEAKSRQAVRRLLRLHPGAAVVVAGCSAQRDPGAYEGIEGVAAVCGMGRRETAEIAIRSAAGDRNLLSRAAPDTIFEDVPAETQIGHTRATLKIEDGCDARCAYCVIPDLRGSPRSRAPESIEKEAEALVARGFREIVLVGINLSRYGAGLPGGLTLADAVEAAARSGIDRIRLGSLEPEALSEALLEHLAKLPQFCPHFHVSLQSGADGTLRRMGRRYNPAQYAGKIETARSFWKNAGITTDVIVGFPGETEEEFVQSCAFVSSIGFLKVHVFPYSRRPGTRADEMPDQVPNKVKEARAAAMQAAAAPSQRAFLDSLNGSEARVLFEEAVSGKPGWLRGYAENYADVQADAGNDAKGKIIAVRLTKTENEMIIGAVQP